MHSFETILNTNLQAMNRKKKINLQAVISPTKDRALITNHAAAAGQIILVPLTTTILKKEADCDMNAANFYIEDWKNPESQIRYKVAHAQQIKIK